MPQSIALPAPSIQFDSEYQFPVLVRTDQSGTGAAIANRAFFAGRPRYEPPAADDELTPLISSGASTTGFVELGGRAAARMQPVGNEGYYFPLPTWEPATGPGTGQAAGSLLPPGWVVAVVDIHMAMQVTAYGGAVADRMGVFFIPDGGSLNPWGPPGGGVAVAAGGFGIMVNNDGAGNNQYEYVSADAVPNIIQRTALPVPDVRLWSTFRFIIRSSTPGAQGTVSLEVNGNPVAAVTALPIDDVTIFRPNTLQAQASTYALGWYGSTISPNQIRTAIYARFGRFTPDGQEVQGIT